MLKLAISLFILGIVVLAVSIGFLFLSEARLNELPRNPVNQLVIAEKKNLGDTKDVGKVGIAVGAVMLGISAAASGMLYWRDR